MGPERASRLRPFMKARLKLELTKSPCRTCARTPLSHAFLLPHRDERTHACTGTLGSVHSTTIFDVARAVVIGAGTTGSDSVGGDNNVNQNQLTTVQGAGVAQTMSVSPVSGSVNRCFVRFILPSISGTVTNAKMRLFMTNPPHDVRTYNVKLVTQTWGEASITYMNQPGVMATPTSSLS